MSTYPLGSFPRFGHQARWASERCYRAQMNSALTRQIQAEEHLEREQALYEILQQLLVSIHLNSPEIIRAVEEQKSSLERAREKHKRGKRAYYGVFGDIFKWFFKSSGTHTEICDYNSEETKDLMISLADQHLAGEQVLTPWEKRSDIS